MNNHATTNSLHGARARANLQRVKKPQSARSPAVATASATAPIPAEPIRFKTNVIVPASDAPGGSRFISAGLPSPYTNPEQVPPRLRPVIMQPEAFESEPKFDQPPSATFTLNTVYNVDENG